MNEASRDMESKTGRVQEGAGEQHPARRKKRVTLSGRRATVASFAAIGVIVLALVALGRFDSVAQNLLDRFRETPGRVAAVAEAPEVLEMEDISLVFAEMDIHPDVLFSPYLDGAILANGEDDVQRRMIGQFRELLDMYVQRQGVDDNFTIRVLDGRTNETLEVAELTAQRMEYQTTGSVNWGAIDNIRRSETNRLVSKWQGRGIPRGSVVVRWGRADQIREARERNAPFIEHELNLARRLGLSLLATQIPTVETFNQDRLISSVGARSRYQMMPYLLRQNGIHHYTLRTASGSSVQVFEEWHPLLTLEPAFATLKGYINAVGHEIPGISAYHTGPGNIFMVYRTFLDNIPSVSSSTSVADAYLWAVTEGFDTVSQGTSFKTYSRGYVPSNYGALKATEETPIDTLQTFLAERVVLQPGASIYLSEVIDLLENDATFMATNRRIASTRDLPSRLYNQIRDLNPHIQLPAFEETGLPPGGDVRFTATSDNVPVRFFLPIGAMDALERNGRDIVNRTESFVYDRNALGAPAPEEVTMYDRQYEALVHDVANFGFTNENRARLIRLRDRFRTMAENNPSHYRQIQYHVIRTHAQIWQSRPFDRLSAMVSDNDGLRRIEGQPPQMLGSNMQ